MKFLTDFELEHLEHESLRIKYRELQRIIEGSQECSCVRENDVAGAYFDEQALEETQKRVEQSIARDTAKGINGYGD